ncbi:DUF5703 domain-containing protein [Pontiella agarivorans]|nr:DUF5703 domain-containing protein [Pontiella agarivorans]
MRFFGALIGVLISSSARANLEWLDEFNVVWDSQSANSGESMPCGGGDIGLNVWVEDGDLLFYIERSGNIDENDQLLKTGRVRIQMEPNPFSADGKDLSFRQELDLKTGSVLITGRSDENNADIRVWVEVCRPVVHVELDTEKKSEITASFESWRNQKQLIPKGDGRDYNRWAMYGYCTYNGDVFSYPDQVDFAEGGVLFFHQNCGDDLIEKEIALQRLDGVIDQMYLPTKNRIFGGVMLGNNLASSDVTGGSYVFTPYKAWNLKSVKPVRQHHIRLVLHTEQTEHRDKWMAGLRKSTAEVSGVWERNVQWWRDFWNRSHIIINKGRGADDKGWQVGRNYQLMRYMLASNAFGEFPIHFNGGLFIYDHFYVDGKRGMNPAFYNADYRKWGAWTGMNQRLVHWPMLKSGDFEMMLPQFEYYRKNLRNAQLRNEVSFGIKGCSFAEQINSAGLPNGYHYGWEPPFGTRNPEHEVGMQYHHTHYFHTQLEFAFMMHEWYRFTGADISPYIPFMKDAVIFHFEYHRMLQRRRTGRDWDENGRLVMKGMQATETYKTGTNPILEAAALRKNLEALFALPDKWVSKKEKELFRDWAARVPELNFRMRNGHRTLSPLLEEKPSSRLCNRELAQLYPVFPYGIYALGLPGLDTAVYTWKYGLDPAGDTYLGKEFGINGYPQREAWWGWGQQVPMLARMGLSHESKEYIVKKMSDAMGDPRSGNFKARFPAFWGPGYGCMPSMEWGGVGMVGLQEMCLQTIAKDGREIRMLPAWPADWDVDFKLHAPGRTIVECVFSDGALQWQQVTPLLRQADVVIGQ